MHLSPKPLKSYTQLTLVDCRCKAAVPEAGHLSAVSAHVFQVGHVSMLFLHLLHHNLAYIDLHGVQCDGKARAEAEDFLFRLLTSSPLALQLHVCMIRQQ